MKRIFYTTGLGLLLTACGGESTADTAITDSVKTDTVAVLPPNIDIDVNALLAKYTVKTNQPFVQDTAYLENLPMTEAQALTGDQIRFLSYNFVESDLSYSGKSTIDDALFFDSLKTNDAYQQYLEVLDLGMMQEADAFVAQRLTIDESTDLLLWVIDFETYPACPFFSGKKLYASIFKNNEVTGCAMVGEISGGGDAPYWSETAVLFSAENGKMSAVKTDRNGGDTDEAGTDIVTESTLTYTLEIVDGNWRVTEQTAAH